MVKKYSIWVEDLPNGKYKFNQKYADPLRSTADHIVLRKVSVTLTKKTAQAKRKAEEILAKKINKKVQASHPNESDILFADLTDKYLEYLKDTDQPYNTRRIAIYEMNLFKKDFGENTIAKNITTPVINSLLEKYLYKDNLANKTVKNKKFYMSSVFEYGISHGLLSTNPTINARVKYKDETVRKKERIENKYLTDDELRTILLYVKDVLHRQDYYDLFKFLSLTGMRISEVIGLTNKDIVKDASGAWIAKVRGNNNYKVGVIYEEEGGNRNIKDARTKTPAGFRSVYLNDEAVEICKRNIENEPRLFLNIKSPGLGIWNNVPIYKFLRRVGRELGIPKKLSSHFFRHTYISKLSELHVPLNVIMQQVGQADSEVTKKIYTHVTQNEQTYLKEQLSKIKL
ncbi:site-specific integrase [uncultured Lactobacillus sp.]|uniref:tyrosine-type recombinase/integrase n=1 Tax=uncultured Lactobacillus sp. TaxID=153152 RepID=UPI00258886A3|nr:site-specific integrase [uncultured Lactobacillus sp.]